MFLTIASFAVRKFLAKKLSAKLREKLFGEQEKTKGGKNDEGGDCTVHLVFATILYCLALIILVYVVMFVHLPSRKFVSSGHCRQQRLS